MNVGAVSYLFAFAAFLALTILLVTSWRGRRIGIWILLASLTSTLWAGASVAATTIGIPALIIQLTEFLRDASWCLFLLQLLRPIPEDEIPEEQTAGLFVTPAEDNDNAPPPSTGFHWNLVFAVIFVFALSVGFLGPIAAHYLPIPTGLLKDLNLVAWVSLSIFGLLMIEQLY